jgi:cytochrome c oxidase subunit I+III
VSVLTPTAPPQRYEEPELRHTWGHPQGLWGWLVNVSHKSVGMRYMVTAFIFFLFGGLEAALMRTQLAYPNNHFLGPEVYNQMFTMHGSTMMYFFAIPFVEGLGLYLVPLMIGTRETAFPRLALFGYYCYLIAGVTLYIAWFCGMGPNAGWFNYPPLSEALYNPGLRIDFFLMTVILAEIGAVTTAVDLIPTILKHRAPGMSLNRMPIFVWTQLITAVMVAFAMPVLIADCAMLEFDRTIGTVFFAGSNNGSPLLWQHLFWWFGHPEVYIIFVPGLGIVSSIVETTAHRPIFGYAAVVLADVGIGFLSFSVWVHHMFATGIPELGLSYFTAASLFVALPSTIEVFCWIGTLWNSRIEPHVGFYFVLGFFWIFVMGGLSGVTLASVPFDREVTDTYYIIAHFHYTIIGATLFPVFAALYHWFHKPTGRLLSEPLGVASFWCMFVGFNAAFFPMHISGLLSMPRRVYTYPPDLGWNASNLASTIGAYILGIGVLLTVINIFWSLAKGRISGRDPWASASLEAYTSSPPADYNFEHTPVVHGRTPMWDRDETGHDPLAVGLATDRREVLNTSTMDGEPDGISVVAANSIWPLFTALAVAAACIGYIYYKGIFFSIGFVAAAVCTILWHMTAPPPSRRRYTEVS